MVAAVTTTRPTTGGPRLLRVALRLMRLTLPSVKAVSCCEHVCGFLEKPTICAGSYHRLLRVLIVEDEPYMAEAIRDGLRLEAITADIAGDGDTALELLSINACDIAVLDRDIPGPSGDEIAEGIVASGIGNPACSLGKSGRNLCRSY